MRRSLVVTLWVAALAAPVVVWADEPDLFAALDVNKDGFITKEEASGEKQRHFERLLRTNDKNGDGKLSREEFTAKAAEPATDPPATRGEGRDRDPAEYFKRLDKDGDGKLSKDEAPERLSQFFDRIDADGDGKIDAAEFREVGARLGAGAPTRPAAGGGAEGPLGEMVQRLTAGGFDRFDANKDGKLTAEEMPEAGREGFARLIAQADKDGDKAVTKEELARFGTAVRDAAPIPLVRLLDVDGNGELSAEEIANASKVLLKLDRNGDGKLTRDELPGPPQGGTPDPRALVEQMQRRLKEADRNGDGKIQKDEAPPPLAAVFDRADANGDGALDEAEVRAAIERLSQRREGDAPRERPRPRD